MRWFATFAAAALLSFSAWSDPPTLEGLRGDARGVRYVEPDSRELEGARSLFLALFEGKTPPASLRSAATLLGFELTEWKEGGDDLVLLREARTNSRGWGSYVFRRGLTEPTVIEAPHAEDDSHTGHLAERLFLEGKPMAAAWNTVPRDTAIPGREGSADLAHLEESVFQSFTRAFLEACPRGRLVQLHGFDVAKRKTATAALCGLIISNGTRQAPAWLSKTARALEAALRDRICVYPVEVSELGATTNAQGRLCREVSHDGFLHMEMDLEARQALRQDSALRKALWTCLLPEPPRSCLPEAKESEAGCGRGSAAIEGRP